MRRAMRIIFNGLTVLSLVLAIGVAALWVRSYGQAAHVTVDCGPEGSINLRLFVTNGVFMFGWYDRGPTNHITPFYWSLSEKVQTTFSPEGFGTVHVERYGFRYWTGADLGRKYLNLWIPMWSLAAIPLVLPIATGAKRVWSARRRTRHQCVVCGYDLRATPDRCPECGAIPSAT